MGGAENLAVNIANTLAERGHDSHLIVIAEQGPLLARVHPQVHLHFLDFQRASIRNPIAFLASLRRGRRLLAALVAAQNIDVVQSHLPGANFMGLMLARKRACAVLPTVHNNAEFRYGDADNRLRTYLRKSAYRHMLKKCQGMVAVSAAVRTSLLADLGLPASAGRDIAVVKNAVPLPAALTDAERDEVRRRFGLAPGQSLLLAAGRFCQQKNFADLVPVAEHLQAAEIPARIVVAGDGDLRPQLQNQVEALALGEQMTMPGNQADLGRVMLAADLFLMPSLWEGLPLVLLEAMAASLPVAAYAIDGVTEVVADGVTGLTVPVGDTHALGQCVTQLLDDPNRRRAMGRAGREKIVQDFSFAALVDELVRLYTVALSQPELASG